MADQLQNLGIEVDGDRVTVVETLGDVAVSTHTVDVGSLTDALEVALSGYKQTRKSAPVRVSLVSPATTVRRMDVTSQLVKSRQAFEDAVFSALPVSREASAPAGLFYDPDNISLENITGGLAVVAPLAAVADTYRALGDTRAEVAPAPLNIRGVDGVWLGLHHSTAEVTVVADGLPVAFRQLRVGGLATVEATIAPDDPQLARQRINAQLTQTGTNDPTVAAELVRYLQTVTSEVAQTVQYWRRSGEAVGDDGRLITYGAAGDAPQLTAVFDEHGFVRHRPDTLEQALMYVPLADRSRSLGAYLAAISTGVGMPQSAFANPVAAEQAAEAARRRRRLLLAGGAAASLLLVAGAVVYPLTSAWLESREADEQLAQARDAFAPYEELYHQTRDLQLRREVIDEHEAGQPNWPRVLDTIYRTRPAGTEVVQLSSSAEGDDAVVSVSVTMPGSSYDPLSAWLSQLRALDEVDEAWSSSFSQQGAGDTAQITAEVSFRTRGDSSMGRDPDDADTHGDAAAQNPQAART